MAGYCLSHVGNRLLQVVQEMLHSAFECGQIEQPAFAEQVSVVRSGVRRLGRRERVGRNVQAHDLVGIG